MPSNKYISWWCKGTENITKFKKKKQKKIVQLILKHWMRHNKPYHFKVIQG